MMYILTEEEYFHLSESHNDLAKLKVALRKEYEQQMNQADTYNKSVAMK